LRHHLRRVEKEVTDRARILAAVRRARYATIALVDGHEPYLVTVSHALDAAGERIYFHCAAEGRKLDCIRSNPRVHGQVIEDAGYLAGECDHAFFTVQFRGDAAIVADPDEKRAAIELLIDSLEPDPAPVKLRLARDLDLGAFAVVRIDVEDWSAKQSPVRRGAS
jgi:nitroimidazol reductase NimA-like FMN-containing flavoprotein (pyridoxamine 5'-phosphate oxidase superfamily)